MAFCTIKSLLTEFNYLIIFVLLSCKIYIFSYRTVADSVLVQFEVLISTDLPGHFLLSRSIFYLNNLKLRRVDGIQVYSVCKFFYELQESSVFNPRILYVESHVSFITINDISVPVNALKGSKNSQFYNV